MKYVNATLAAILMTPAAAHAAPNGGPTPAAPTVLKLQQIAQIIDSTTHFDKFDASLGTLVAVDMVLSAQLGFSGYANYVAPNPGGTGTSITSSIQWSFGGVTMTSALSGGIGGTFVPGRNSVNGQLALVSGNRASFASPTPLTSFLSTSTATMPLLTFAAPANSVGFGGGVLSGSVDLARLPMGNATLTYTYLAAPGVAAVPEPATWALMMGGFAMVAVAMRRRQRVCVRYA